MGTPVYIRKQHTKTVYKALLTGAAISMLILFTTGCESTLERMKQVGLPPDLEPVQNPTERPGYAPITMPLPEMKQGGKHTAGSLWLADGKAFFKDARARSVGDILTVKINIKEKAELDNKTERSRDTDDTLAAPNIFGLEKKITGLLPEKADPSNLLNITGKKGMTGEGKIEREETVETEIAAVITQVLPNGNMVIYGSQEIRINFEVRQLSVQGVVRPQDIDTKNVVELRQIAEARVSYGGRGHITDVQQERIGTQMVDILSPW